MFKKCSQSLEKLLLFSFFQIFQGYFTVQLSRLFVLLLLSSFCIIPKLSSLVKNFFKLFFAVLFDLFRSRSRQLVYIITRFFICQHVFSFFYKFFMSFYVKPKRRRGDLNPRAGFPTYTLSRGTSSAT